MEVETYAIEAEVEESHWWFVGRRRLFGAELERTRVAKDARILDIGTGTGSTLRMLRRLGYHDVRGLDVSDQAILFCASKGHANVSKGDICALPFEDGSFDFVFATDILEHVKNDGRAAQEIARVLAPEGKVLLTVPAFPSLWGVQDIRGCHRRRYRMAELIEVLRAAGLIPARSYYFNYLLFAPIFLTRKTVNLLRLQLQSENRLNSPLLNSVLTALFAFDVWSAPAIKPPFGVSILALARKASGTTETDRATV